MKDNDSQVSNSSLSWSYVFAVVRRNSENVACILETRNGGLSVLVYQDFVKYMFLPQSKGRNNKLMLFESANIHNMPQTFNSSRPTTKRKTTSNSKA